MVETTEQREALMSFYSSLHGWTWEVGGENMGYYSIAHSEGASVMGLRSRSRWSRRDGAVLLDRRHQRLGRNRGRVGRDGLHDPMEVPGAGIMALVTDPTGAVHGLWQEGEFKGFGVAYEANAPGWYDHASDDPAAAAAYYTTLTGNTVIEPSPGMRSSTSVSSGVRASQKIRCLSGRERSGTPFTSSKRREAARDK